MLQLIFAWYTHHSDGLVMQWLIYKGNFCFFHQNYGKEASAKIGIKLLYTKVNMTRKRLQMSRVM